MQCICLYTYIYNIIYKIYKHIICIWYISDYQCGYDVPVTPGSILRWLNVFHLVLSTRKLRIPCLTSWTNTSQALSWLTNADQQVKNISVSYMDKTFLPSIFSKFSLAGSAEDQTLEPTFENLGDSEVWLTFPSCIFHRDGFDVRGGLITLTGPVCQHSASLV